MPVYWDEMFNTQGESTTLADMNLASSTATGQGYAPLLPGRLMQVVLMWAGEAVTSLAEFARVELKCTLWRPNLLKFGLVMANIRTAPAVPVPRGEFGMDQEANPTQPIAGQYIYADAATPITCNLRVFGQFSTL